MFRKNSIEFFIGLSYYLYYFYKWLYPKVLQSQVFPEYSVVT